MDPNRSMQNIKAGSPVVLFQVSRSGLELLNRGLGDQAGLTPEVWETIARGGWRNIVPEEYHPEVQQLTALNASESYTVAEFPVYWQGTTIWLLIFAAAVEEPEGGRKVVGLAQDVTSVRESGGSSDLEHDGEHHAHTTLGSGTDIALVHELCHDVSGPLTSILVGCEILLDRELAPAVREKVEEIFEHALQIDQYLRIYRSK